MSDSRFGHAGEEMEGNNVIFPDAMRAIALRVTQDDKVARGLTPGGIATMMWAFAALAPPRHRRWLDLHGRETEPEAVTEGGPVSEELAMKLFGTLAEGIQPQVGARIRVCDAMAYWRDCVALRIGATACVISCSPSFLRHHHIW